MVMFAVLRHYEGRVREEIGSHATGFKSGARGHTA